MKIKNVTPRTCDQRHPQECRYYRDYKRCKFGIYCFYEHVVRTHPVFEELKLLKARLEVIENEIEEKNNELNLTLERMEHAVRNLTKSTLPVVSNSLSQSSTSEPPNMSTLTPDQVGLQPTRHSQRSDQLGHHPSARSVHKYGCHQHSTPAPSRVWSKRFQRM